MALTDIQKGTKIQICEDPGIVGVEYKWNLFSSFAEADDDSSFYISAPMNGTEFIEPDDSQKYLIRYGTGNDTQIIVCYCDMMVKKGIRHYWKMRKVSLQRQFIQRADERYRVGLPCEYYQSTWDIGPEGKIQSEACLTMDISAGGVALYINLKQQTGDMIQLTLPRVGTEEDGEEIKDIVGSIMWHRETPKGSMYKHLYGVKFRFENEMERETMKKYIENVREVYKL